MLSATTIWVLHRYLPLVIVRSWLIILKMKTTLMCLGFSHCHRVIWFGELIIKFTPTGTVESIVTQDAEPAIDGEPNPNLVRLEYCSEIGHQ